MRKQTTLKQLLTIEMRCREMLGKGEYAILTYIFTKKLLNEEEFRPLKQIKMAQDLKMHQSNISRGIKKLVLAGILDRAGEKYNHTYKLSLAYAAK